MNADNEYKWDWPELTQKNVGINNGNIEQFMDTPIASLAREICQNSLDARVDDSKPVVVEFKMFSAATSSLPDWDTYVDSVQRGYDFWKPQKNPKADNFYKKALTTAKGDSLNILRISDFNTCGLSGSDRLDDTTAKWTALVMSEGASVKDGSGGGSFGLGKFSSFANSILRTVFYSTVADDGSVASQGLSIQASFLNHDDQKTNGEGYCGNNSKPVYDQINFDPDFKRTTGTKGTDIFIIAFNNEGNWKNELIASVIDGFLYAIHNNSLVVKVNGEEVSAKTLDEIMSVYSGDISDYAKDYYSVLNDPETKWISLQFEDMGTVKIKLRIKQGLNRTCAMVRKTGMKILDRNGIAGQIPFSGIMYIEGDEINKYLTSLENPTHTDWLVKRGPHGEAEAKKVLAKLNKFVKDELNKMIDSQTTEYIDPELEGMEDVNAGSDGKDKKQDVLTDELTTQKARKRKPSFPQQTGEKSGKTSSGSGDEESEGGNSGDGESTGEGSGYGEGNGGRGMNGGSDPGERSGDADGDKPSKVTKIFMIKRKTIVATNAGKGEYKIKIRSGENIENGILEITESGEDNSYSSGIKEISIENMPSAEFKNGKIFGIQAEADKAFTVNLKIDSTDLTSFEVKVYASETK